MSVLVSLSLVFAFASTAGTIHSSFVPSGFNAFAASDVDRPITLGYPFYLSINQTASSQKDDILVRFVNVTEDSRCPTDVQCIWAGQVSILVELSRISDGQIVGELTLTKGPGDSGTLASKSIDGFIVGLGLVEPVPVSTKKIQLTDYIIQLVVKRADDKPDTITTAGPVAIDSGKNVLDKVKVGQSVMVSTAIHNNSDEDKQYVVILDVRSPDGVTQFLGFPNGVLSANSFVDLGLGPWVPVQSGTYELRTFVLDNFDAPQILSPVSSSKIIVEEDTGYTIGNATSIILGNNQFALDFYSNIATSQNGDSNGSNIFFSPWSISNALALVDEGAKGQTAKEIQTVFGLPSDANSRRTSFEVVINDLIKNNSTAQNYTLDIANAVWLKKGYHLSNDYANAAIQYYGSEVSNADFTTEQAREQINSWVESKTHDKIKNLFPPGVLNELTRLVITNAVYFKGTWITPFDENATSLQAFKVDDDTTVQIPMMALKSHSHFKYAETHDFQILELPYDGEKLSMLVILPRDGLVGLHLLEEDSLTLDNLSKWKAMLRNQSVIVNIPKFKLETSYILNDMLSEMGMPTAFDPNNADLSGMLEEPEQLYVQAALHKAFVEVNEQGTEAAAATGVSIGITSVQEYPVFRADHPFIFLIQDSETGNILFMGRIVDPTE
jgi:serpin B